jgi:thiamine biosynthesis lipoprotein
MGTAIEITLLGEDEKAAERAALQAFQELKRIEQLMSPRIESGDVFRLNRSAGKGWVRVSPETMHVIKKAQEVSGISEGGFDVSVGPLAQLWRTARERKIPPPLDEIERTLSLVDFRNILVDGKKGVFLGKERMAVDLGGIAKGYGVDRAYQVLKRLGYENLIVKAGGDMRVGGSKFGQPWTIGIQHPRVPERLIARIAAAEESIATSGDYERFFIHEGRRYHHILNPGSGYPAEGCQSVTVFHREGITADALSTAIFVLGPEKGYALCLKLAGVECIIVDREGKTTFTPGLKARALFFSE